MSRWRPVQADRLQQKIHYTLQTREPEYELVPIALDQEVGILVWSPLGGGPADGKVPAGAA
jgi:aryl-alcohol dehydrogenase-like predicted oxidoreductase